MDYPTLASLQAGDFESWKFLSDILAPKIRAAIWHKLGAPDVSVVEDLESAVFSWLVAALKAQKFNDMQHLEVRAIIKARSLAIDHIRKEQSSPIDRGKPLETGDEGPTATAHADQPGPEEELMERELADILVNLLNTIRPKHREVLKLLFLEEKTQEETAKQLCMPIGTVGVYRARGLEAIKGQLKLHSHLLEDLKEKFGSIRLTFEIAVIALLLK